MPMKLDTTKGMTGAEEGEAFTLAMAKTPPAQYQTNVIFFTSQNE
jgi:hypothetical protein